MGFGEGDDARKANTKKKAPRVEVMGRKRRKGWTRSEEPGAGKRESKRSSRRASKGGGLWPGKRRGRMRPELSYDVMPSAEELANRRRNGMQIEREGTDGWAIRDNEGTFGQLGGLA